MAGKQTKREVITFKVDAALREAMKGVPNRSEFIRSAILSASGNTCPLCKGQGLLSPEQLEHWRSFSRKHHVAECADCHALHLVCSGDVAIEGHSDSMEKPGGKEDRK
ncbi:CopG family transcriptional regulator [bacterium]|nr:CopG family transcriptional regulator [bacterium]